MSAVVDRLEWPSIRLTDARSSPASICNVAKAWRRWWNGGGDGAVAARMWFGGNLESNSEYSFAGSTSVEAAMIHTHPGHRHGPWWLHDLGVVVLDDPINDVAYGKLPGLDSLHKYQKKVKQNKARFTAVGYGLQKAFPDAAG